MTKRDRNPHARSDELVRKLEAELEDGTIDHQAYVRKLLIYIIQQNDEIICGQLDASDEINPAIRELADKLDAARP